MTGRKAERRLACYRAAVPAHEVFGHHAAAMLDAVPAAVDAGDRHVAAAALVLLDYARQFSDRDKVYIVSNNLKHLAMADMATLGVCVVSAGQFIDRLTQADSARIGQALDKSVNNLISPPYTRERLLAALLLHGATETARHFEVAWR